jgi:hypothetical protein
MDINQLHEYFLSHNFSIAFIRKNNPQLYNELEHHVQPAAYLYSRATGQVGLCKECGSPTKFFNYKKGFNDFCSPQCGGKSQLGIAKKEENSLKERGFRSPNQDPSVKEKQKATMLERYGVEHNVCLPHIREKSKLERQKNRVAINEKKKNNSRKKYGFDSPNQDPSIRGKQITTMLERYGVSCNFLRPDVQKKNKLEIQKNKTAIAEKKKNNSRKKHGVDSPNQIQSIKEKQLWASREYRYNVVKENNRDIFTFNFSPEEYTTKNNHYNVTCCQCGKTQTINLADRKFCSCQKYRSREEKEIADYIESLGLTYESNVRTIIPPWEVDIYIPELQVAIEYCGLYWHSELSGKTKNYHRDKHILCGEKGIRLITIFSDEWVNKKEIVKNRLKHILCRDKIFVGARKCQIKEITYSLYSDFLEKNHIQGKIKSLVKLGAFYNGDLVAVMGFGSYRRSMNKKQSPGCYEMLRFSTKAVIPGIAGKLLKYFMVSYNPVEIVSYCDIRWGTGNLYRELGFQLSHTSSPNYWYLKDYTCRLYRYGYRKSILISQGHSSELTEWAIMQSIGFDRIWDCGNYVFLWKKNNNWEKL